MRYDEGGHVPLANIPPAPLFPQVAPLAKALAALEWARRRYARRPTITVRGSVATVDTRPNSCPNCGHHLDQP